MDVDGVSFFQQASGDDYILYQAHEPHKLGDITVHVFLERVPDKGWWGAIRLKNIFRIQLNLNPSTLFPTAEIALAAVEEFLTDEQFILDTLEDMRKNEVMLQTFHNAPSRPEKIDPEKYFSPLILEVDEYFFTLFSITEEAASYRLWKYRAAEGSIVDLRMSHVYHKGWQAALRFPDRTLVICEPAPDQLFETAQQALKALLSFCSQEDLMSDLLQKLKRLAPEERLTMTRNPEPPPEPKPPFRVKRINFVWKERISEGELYQATRPHFVGFKKVYIQLIETWRRGWIASFSFQNISGIYLEKERAVGFSTPEEAFVAARTVLSKDLLLRTRQAYVLLLLWRRETGKYNQIMSMRSERIEKGEG